MEKEKKYNYTVLNNTNNTALNQIIQRYFLNHEFIVTELVRVFLFALMLVFSFRSLSKVIFK